MPGNEQHQQSNINQVRELLSPYLDGEVTEEERALVEQALAESAGLRQELDTLRQTVALVAGLPQAAAPRPFTLREADTQPQSTGRGASTFLPPWIKLWAMVAATFLCVVIAGGLLLGPQIGGVMFSTAPDEIALLEEAAEPTAMEATAQPQPPAEEAIVSDEAAEEEMAAPEVGRGEEEAGIAGQAATPAEDQAVAAERAATEETIPEQEASGGEANMAVTPSPLPSPTPEALLEQAVPEEESAAAPPAPAAAEGVAEEAEEPEEPAQDKLTTPTATVEPAVTPPLTVSPTSAAQATAIPGPSPTVTPVERISEAAPARSLTLIIALGVAGVAITVGVIGLVIWLLAKRRRK